MDASSSSTSSHTAHTGFPIIAVAIIGILATGFLLVGYYVFVIKCCLNWHRIDLLRRFSLSGRRRGEDGRMIDRHSAAAVSNGLDEATIRAIPVFPYRKWKKIGEESDQREREACEIECAVCLNEFEEEEKLRVIPDCAHIFHVDCIDVWLQNNANCPLCRRSISSNPNQFLGLISASSPTNSGDHFTGRDEDYVVIEISQITPERSNSASSRKVDQKVAEKNSRRKKKMSHECIDIRLLKTEEQFAVQPIRRSFSMDSASDPHLHLAVEEIIKKHQQEQQEGSSSSRLKRSFFSFGNGRSTSRSAVLPLHMES